MALPGHSARQGPNALQAVTQASQDGLLEWGGAEPQVCRGQAAPGLGCDGDTLGQPLPFPKASALCPKQPWPAEGWKHFLGRAGVLRPPFRSPVPCRCWGWQPWAWLGQPLPAELGVAEVVGKECMGGQTAAPGHQTGQDSVLLSLASGSPAIDGRWAGLGTATGVGEGLPHCLLSAGPAAKCWQRV